MQRETAKQPYLAWKYIYLVVFHTKSKNTVLTLDNFSLSSQQLVPNYFLYHNKGSDVYFGPIFTKWTLLSDSPPFDDRWDLSEVMEKTDCRELLKVHRNVIDVKSIAFLVILLAPEDSFVTLHMRWHKGCFPKASTKKEIASLSS